MTSNNVVRFPKGSSISKKKDMDELLEDNKIRFSDNLVDHYGTQLLGKLATHGISVDNPTFLFDYVFAMEALRAAILRSIEVGHPMHKLFDSNEALTYFITPPNVTKDS